MSIALIMPGRDVASLRRRLSEALPDVDVQVWPDIDDPGSVTFAVVWKHPAGSVAALPNVRAVTSYGAGVDFIVADRTLPENIEVGRIVDPGLARQVAGYLLAIVLQRSRELPRYRADQKRRRWRPATDPVWPTVGILGLGRIGRFAGQQFAALGMRVLGWRASSKSVAGIEVFTGDEGLRAMAPQCDYLICTLPLTDATRGLLNASLFSAMQSHGIVINVGRGEQLVEADLLAALERQEIGGAVLDVFAEEPLPPEHPFWRHPGVTVTPHVAGLTDPKAAARMIAESYRSLMDGRGVLSPVDPARGY